MDWMGWATFGFVATATMTAIMVAGQLAGLSRIDLPLILGTIFAGQPERARTIGIVVHMLNGQVFGLVYASAFSLLGRAGWGLGALFGLLHGLIALTIILPALPGIHPRMASERSGPSLVATVEPPGPLALNFGSQTPLITLAAHAVYGAMLGGFLSPG